MILLYSFVVKKQEMFAGRQGCTEFKHIKEKVVFLSQWVYNNYDFATFLTKLKRTYPNVTVLHQIPIGG